MGLPIYLLKPPSPGRFSRSLVAHYAMEAVALANEPDLVGSATMTQLNGVGQAAGLIGNSRSFSAAGSQRLQSTSSALQGAGRRWAVAGWFYVNSLGANRTIFGRWSGSGNREWLLRALAAGNYQLSASANGTAFTVDQSFGVPSLSTWNLAIVWWDGATINCQINDGVVNSFAFVGALNVAGALFLGAFGSGSSEPLDGRLDLVSAWRDYYPLAHERTWLWNSGAGRSLAEMQAY